MSPKPFSIVASVFTSLATLGLPACATPPTPARAEAGPPAAPGGVKAEEADDPVLADLVELHNRERAKEDLPPLKVSAKLRAAAKVQADDMAEREKMAHEGSDGSTPSERIARQDYRNRGSGENVAYGQPSAEAVMRAWMDSPGHRKNILGNFGEIGVARAKSKEGEIFWCVDFGLPWPKLDTEGVPEAVVEGLNRARKEADLPPLKIEPKLAKAAENLARSMAERKKLDPKGDALTEQVNNSGFKYRSLNAAFANGQATPEEAVNTWTGRREQKKVVLGDATAVGVGCASDEDGVPYWCLLLATPQR